MQLCYAVLILIISVVKIPMQTRLLLLIALAQLMILSLFLGAKELADVFQGGLNLLPL